MPTIFNSKDSVFFVGGKGTKVGDWYAGGCTLSFWNNSLTLSDVMGTNGEPVSAADAWNGSGTACDISNNGGKVKLTKEGAFISCQAGLVAMLAFDTGEYSDGRFEVISCDDNSITVDLTYSPTGQTEGDAKVGGAFDNAQNAWNDTDATNGYSVTIYSNKSQSKSNGDFTGTWNLGTAGGSFANKSFKRLCGFTTQPGDGGQITLDGEDDVGFIPFGGIRFNSAIANVIFENIIVEDAFINWSSGHADVYSIRFKNCEGNSCAGDGWALNVGRGFVLTGCKADGNSSNGFNVSSSSGTPGHCLINCIASNNTQQGFYRVGGYSGSIAIGCVAYGNGKGGTKYSGFSVYSNWGWGVVMNCVAYDNGKHGFEFYRYNPIVINCIAKDNGQWGFYADISGSLMAPYVAYCCAHSNSSGQFSLVGALPEQDSIEQDPQFVDAANGDFRPRNPAVLRGGKPDISGNPTQMGVILQKYQFGDRERITNMARLRIVR
ncbi:MAG: hypothetical protein AMJ75_02120 [Phycisphaerae bacterium SM1_79]|nr:MAG: hypothetical protein AMJ75_02120 [Phycisphaerae bacterium SM1_79]